MHQIDACQSVSAGTKKRAIQAAVDFSQSKLAAPVLPCQTFVVQSAKVANDRVWKFERHLHIVAPLRCWRRAGCSR